MNSGLVVVLTALNLEYQAVRERLAELRVHRHQAGTRFEVGRIGSTGCRVVVALVGKGNHPAAVLAERAMAEFSPTAVLFVGVAGGLWPHIRLGDVVVATKIYAYHGGTSEDDGLKSRPKAWEIPHEADQIAQHVARHGVWTRDLPVGSAGATPVVHFGPIATGEIVHNSAVSEQARWIREHYNDAVAIEMEAAGVAQAGHLNRALPVVVVRGISDRADGSKARTDGQNWQPRAAANAAGFATALAQELSAEDASGARRTADGTPAERVTMTHQNIAAGSARVGVQAGQIYGTVTVGGDVPFDLATAMTDLRGRLHQANRDGRLDDETYAAAEKELDVAIECLQTGAARNKSTLVMALKRLRGLVADVAELAARLAAILAMARRTS
jgi:adenosylhomocysteine nucleosidase